MHTTLLFLLCFRNYYPVIMSKSIFIFIDIYLYITPSYRMNMNVHTLLSLLVYSLYRKYQQMVKRLMEILTHKRRKPKMTFAIMMGQMKVSTLTMKNIQNYLNQISELTKDLVDCFQERILATSRSRDRATVDQIVTKVRKCIS